MSGVAENGGRGGVRLSLHEWLAAVAVIAAVLLALPQAWRRIDAPADAPNSRVPYRLSGDYWMFERLAARAAAEGAVAVIGDSVIWGHYVSAAETLPAHLGEAAESKAALAEAATTGAPRGAAAASNARPAGAGRAVRFANLGVDGIHPAAMHGLVAYHGRAVAGGRVVLHCNPLWTSSRRHDLTAAKEFAFNHPRLVPQFIPWIPCYRETADGRLAIVVGRYLPWGSWAEHLRVARFGGRDLAGWAVEHPYECPVRQLALELPSADDGPDPPPDARAWTEKGVPAMDADWVPLGESLQWASLRATVDVLRGRGCRVFVLVGPFNEHMLAPASREAYKDMKSAMAAWLRDAGVGCLAPAPLPSSLYADASHPLAEGYRLLAERLGGSEEFQTWLRNE